MLRPLSVVLALLAAIPAQGPASLLADVNPFAATNNSSSSPALGAQVGTSGPIVFAASHSATGRELWRVSSTGLVPALLCDIAPGLASSSPTAFVAVGSLVFFLADDGTHGQELWQTDGTTGGTGLVTDLRPGSEAAAASALVEFQDRLWFQADNGTSGPELWRSDGTAAGTVQVIDLQPGSVGSSPTGLTVVGSTLFFAATTVTYGNELWKSGGTAATTVLVRDISSGTTSSAPAGLAPFGSLLCFSALTSASGRELWKSDGTGGGTVMVKDIGSGGTGSSPRNLTAAGSNLFFVAGTGATGAEPWVSDGTSSGTTMLRDIGPGFYGSEPADLVARGSTVIFTANESVNLGRELWKSDGTAAGTVLISDIRPGYGGSNPSDLTLILQGTGPLATGYVYLRADDGGSGAELWRTNGTAAGTTMVADLAPGSAGSSPAGFFQAAGMRGTSFLFAAHDARGTELWRSTGSAAGTTCFDLDPPTADAQPELLAAASGRAFFAADDSLTGRELWFTDGSAVGTQRVADVLAGPTGSAPDGAVIWNGVLYFSALDTANNRALWRSDATAAGTWSLGALYPDHLTLFAGALFFSAFDGGAGFELWRSDGTLGGTARLVDLAPGTANSSPTGLLPFGGRLLFSAGTPAVGRELFVTDGTAAGTVLLADISPGTTNSNPTGLTAVGNVVCFSANDGAVGNELWRTDGTAAGTVRISDLWPGSGGSTPSQLTAVQFLPGTWTLCCVASTPVYGREVFRVETTGGSPLLIRDLRPGPLGSEPRSLTRVPRAGGDLLLFAADDGVSGLEPWLSSGTPASTLQLADVWPGGSSSLPDAGGWFFTLPGSRQILFPASDGVSGLELWRHDLVAATTVLHQDVHAGPMPGNPSRPLLLGSRLLFTANDGTHGSELWSMACMATAGPYGSGCAGGSGLTAVLSATDTPFMGNAAFGYRIAGAPGNCGAFMLFDFQRSNLAFGPCTVLVQPAIVHFLVTSGAGIATFPLPVSGNPTFIGLPVFAQALILDPAAPIAGLLSATNGIHAILGPN